MKQIFIFWALIIIAVSSGFSKEKLWEYVRPQPFTNLLLSKDAKRLYHLNAKLLYHLSGSQITKTEPFNFKYDYKKTYRSSEQSDIFFHNSSSNSIDVYDFENDIFIQKDLSFIELTNKTISNYCSNYISVSFNPEGEISIYDLNSKHLLRTFSKQSGLSADYSFFSPSEAKTALLNPNYLYLYDFALDSIVFQYDFSQARSNLERSFFLSDSIFIVHSNNQILKLNFSSKEADSLNINYSSFIPVVNSDSVVIAQINSNNYLINLISGEQKEIPDFEGTAYNNNSYFGALAAVQDEEKLQLLSRNLLDTSHIPLITQDFIKAKPELDALKYNNFINNTNDGYWLNKEETMKYISYEKGIISDSFPDLSTVVSFFYPEYFWALSKYSPYAYKLGFNDKTILDSINIESLENYQIVSILDSNILLQHKSAQSYHLFKNNLLNEEFRFYAYRVFCFNQTTSIFQTILSNDSSKFYQIPNPTPIANYYSKDYIFVSVFNDSTIFYVKKSNPRTLFKSGFDFKAKDSIVYDADIYSFDFSSSRNHLLLNSSQSRNDTVFNLKDKSEKYTFNYLFKYYTSADFRYVIDISGDIYSNYYCWKMNELDSGIVSVEAVIKESSLKVFPNPSSGKVYISGENLSGISQISLYNICGELLQEIDLNYTEGTIQLPVMNFESGLYYLRVTFKNEQDKYIPLFLLEK